MRERDRPHVEGVRHAVAALPAGSRMHVAGADDADPACLARMVARDGGAVVGVHLCPDRPRRMSDRVRPAALHPVPDHRCRRS